MSFPTTKKYLNQPRLDSTTTHGQPEGIFVKMTCYSGEYRGNLQTSAEIEAMRWFSYSEKDQVVGVDKLIFDHLNGQGLLN